VDRSVAHHFLAPAKLTLMREICRIVGERGLFLIYENTSPDGEDRDAWLRRWDRQWQFWPMFTPEEWDAITAHVPASDFPETTAKWESLGPEAGFRPSAGTVRRADRPVPDVLFSGVRCRPSHLIGREPYKVVSECANSLHAKEINVDRTSASGRGAPEGDWLTEAKLDGYRQWPSGSDRCFELKVRTRLNIDLERIYKFSHFAVA
jgi:hypothetical protein